MPAWPHICHVAKDDLACLILWLLTYTVQLLYAVLDIGPGPLAGLASSPPTELHFQSWPCPALCNMFSHITDLTGEHILRSLNSSQNTKLKKGHFKETQVSCGSDQSRQSLI